jgi:glutaredoxin 3
MVHQPADSWPGAVTADTIPNADREAAGVAEIVVFTKAWCPYCRRAMELLDRKGVLYREIPVEHRPEAEREMIRRAGGRTTVPQIFVGDRHLGGCDDLHELERKGLLDDLLVPPTGE